MKKIINFSILCAFLIAISANLANAQNCPNSGCEYNNVQISGSDIMYHWSVEFYGLPQVSGVSYVWGTGGYLNLFSGGWSAGAGFASPYYGGGNTYYPQDEYCSVNCTVICKFGHTHYFSKKVLITN